MDLCSEDVIGGSGENHLINSHPYYRVNKEYRRGLLDILDIHACSGVVQGSDVRNASSKDEFPYAPSLKSIPTSSTTASEVSDCSKKNDTSNYSQTGVTSSNYNPEEISNQIILDKYLDYKEGLGKRNTSTDTFRVSDIIPEQSDESLMNKDSWNDMKPGKPYCLTETTGRKETDGQGASDSSERCSQNRLNSNIDSSEQSLRAIGITNKYRKQRENCRVFYDREQLWCSFSSTESTIRLKESPVKNEAETVRATLRLFDCNKFPLTDSEGNVLLSANNQHLLIFKNGKPAYDCFKRPVYDENGETSESIKFQPYSTAHRGKKLYSEIGLYNFRGYPLTDSYGTVLTNADNRHLIRTGRNGELLSDLNGHPIFDKSGIPLTKKEGRWLLPDGSPYRVFDRRGYPLTDRHGTPLHTKNNLILLVGDRHGRPVSDCKDEPVFDCTGNRPSERAFDPTVHHEPDQEIVVALLDNSPLQLYDRQGYPLTTTDGELLKDASGRYILNFRYNNLKKYNCKYIVLPCKLQSFDDCSPESFYYEEAITDNNKNTVFNREGKRVVLDLLYNNPSRPISDSLSDNSNKSSERIHPVKDNNEEYVGTDIDTSDTRTLLYEAGECEFEDRYGRPTHDLFLRPLYDTSGRPLATANGKLLSDGTQETPTTRMAFRLAQVTPAEVQDIFTDLLGRPLYDNNGRPKYNPMGKPLTDAYGRPLYDGTGLPLSDENGLPASLLIKQKNLKILAVEDKSQRIVVSSRNNDISSDSKRSMMFYIIL